MINEIIKLFIERKDFFIGLLVEHLQISFIAIVLSSILGLLLGILISEYKKASKLTLGMINFIYTIPSISLLGILIPISGIGNTSAIIALVIYGLLPMVRNTYTGISNIDDNVIEAAKGMGSTDFQILYKIKIPLAMPIIIAGFRNMATMTIALAGIASFIGAGGLGVAIYRGITTNNSAMTMLGSLMIALLAIVVDLILGKMEKVFTIRTKTTRSKKIVSTLIASGLCLILIITSLYQPNSSNVIKIATKPMSEQYIIGEILKELIEQETNLKVSLTQGVGGGTSNIQPAILKGDFDLYPEYTGTGWNMVLKKDGLYNENMFEELKNEYQSKLKLTWIGMYGFNNTYGLVVRREIAEAYNLKTYSDLASISNQLVFGGEYDFFEREDGYDALSKAYNYTFKSTMDLDIGLKYQALSEGKIDVMNIFTTDGKLSKADVVVLQDDLQFYPSYMCGNVIREETLKKYPELKQVFEKLAGLIDDEEIAKMNYQVENEKKEPSEVAHQFLLENKLIK